MKRKMAGILAVMLGMMIVLGGCGKKSLKRYELEYGFRMSGIPYEIVAYQKEDAFQDPWTAYVIRITGDVKGTVFDPETMSTELSEGTLTAVRCMIDDCDAEQKMIPFHLTQEGEYRANVLPSLQNSRKRLNIIYDIRENLYYILWF